MVKIIVENKKKLTIRPSTANSTMFVCYDGKLYSGHYLRTNIRTGLRINGLGVDDNNKMYIPV